jgi:hypothetical protein
MTFITKVNTDTTSKTPGVLPKTVEPTKREASDNERLFFRVASCSIAVGFGFEFAAMESTGMDPSGFSLHITIGTLLAFVIGVAFGWSFWRIVARDSGSKPSPIQRLATILLVLGSVGGFLYPLRFLSHERLVETLQGLVSVAVALSLVGFMLWRIKGFLERDAVQAEMEAKERVTGQRTLLIRAAAEDRVNNLGASSGALTYESKLERSNLRGIQPGRRGLMNKGVEVSSDAIS